MTERPRLDITRRLSREAQLLAIWHHIAIIKKVAASDCDLFCVPSKFDHDDTLVYYCLMVNCVSRVSLAPKKAMKTVSINENRLLKRLQKQVNNGKVIL